MAVCLTLGSPPASQVRHAVSPFVEGVAEPCVVVHWVDLAPRREQGVSVDPVDSLEADLCAALNHRVLAQVGEKRLHVVGNPDAEFLDHGVGDAGLDVQSVACGKSREATGADVAISRLQTEGVEVVDAVG